MTSPEAAPRLRCADCDYPVRLTHRYPGAKQPARSHPVRIEAEAAAGHTWCEHGIRDDANCSQPHEAAAGTALDVERLWEQLLPLIRVKDQAQARAVILAAASEPAAGGDG